MAPADTTKDKQEGTSAQAASSTVAGDEAKKALPQLGALEEDDEFEEFEAEDWDDSETTAAQLTTSIKGKSDALNNAHSGNAGGGVTGQSKTGTNALDSLWEDNWDDDDIEDDFSVQLRKAISEYNGTAMATS